jgi:hypothetical protein
MEEIFKKIKDSLQYKELQTINAFDKSKCNSRELVGSVAGLCKLSKAQNFDEWCLYYIKSDYIGTVKKANERLFDFAKDKINITKDECFDCLLTFILYQTWNGIQKEYEAAKLLRSCMYKVNFATPQEDLDLAIDLYITRNGKRLFGIQVKPISYKYKKEKYPDNYYVMINNEKNKKYKELYGYDVLYVYYDKDFDNDDIYDLKTIIRGCCK